MRQQSTDTALPGARVARYAECGPSEVPFVQGSDGPVVPSIHAARIWPLQALSLARTALAPGSGWHSLPGRWLHAKLSGGVESLGNLGEVLGGQLHAARGVFGEVHLPEQVPELYGASSRWEVQISKPVDRVLGDRRLIREVRPLQVVVKVYVADERRQGGALFDVVEAEDARREGRMPHIQTDAHSGMPDHMDLPGQLGRPDRVVVDRAAQDRPIGVVVLVGYGQAKLFRQVSRPPKGRPFGHELVTHAVPEVARGHPLAGVADYYLRADTVREPEAGVEDGALKGG
jgi:hypothetical protein